MQIKSEMQHHESQKFHYQVAEYVFLIQNIKTHLILSKLQPLKVWLHRTENGLSEKLDFPMPCCSILFTDSEYTTLFETPSILSELQPIKVRKSTG